MRTDWQDDAACARVGGDHWWPPKGRGTTTEAVAARRTCGRCPVRIECLTYAVTNGETKGVWGGLTEKERRKWTVTADGELIERDPKGEVAA